MHDHGEGELIEKEEEAARKWAKKVWWHCFVPMRRLDSEFHQCRVCEYVKLTSMAFHKGGK